MSPPSHTLRPIRLWTSIFILGLILSGLTAIPISSAFAIGAEKLGHDFQGGGIVPGFVATWLSHVAHGIAVVDREAPYFYYGTDWLAFGHIAIAVAFIGALRDPVRNRWLYTFGMIACVLVIPWALGFGHLRGIPVWWRMIDSSFGVFGILPLWYCHRRTARLERDRSL